VTTFVSFVVTKIKGLIFLEFYLPLLTFCLEFIAWENWEIKNLFKELCIGPHMENYEENIPLAKEDLEKIKKILKNKKFEELKIHGHYWLKRTRGIPRHGFNLDELKKLFNKMELIKYGFKRKFMSGFGYTLLYKISTNKFVKICYFFDESPIKIFNAIPINRNLEKAVSKRYCLRI